MYLYPAVERNLQIVSHTSTTGNMDNWIRHVAFCWEAELSFLTHLNFIQNRNKQIHQWEKIKLLSQYTVYFLRTREINLNCLCIPSTWHRIGVYLFPRMKQESYIISLRSHFVLTWHDFAQVLPSTCHVFPALTFSFYLTLSSLFSHLNSSIANSE